MSEAIINIDSQTKAINEYVSNNPGIFEGIGSELVSALKTINSFIKSKSAWFAVGFVSTYDYDGHEITATDQALATYDDFVTNSEMVQCVDLFSNTVSKLENDEETEIDNVRGKRSRIFAIKFSPVPLGDYVLKLRARRASVTDSSESVFNIIIQPNSDQMSEVYSGERTNNTVGIAKALFDSEYKTISIPFSLNSLDYTGNKDLIILIDSTDKCELEEDDVYFFDTIEITPSIVLTNVPISEINVNSINYIGKNN